MKIFQLDAGIDPRVSDLRAASQTGTGTGATTPDIDKPDDVEAPDEVDEAEEPEGELRNCETNFLTIQISRV